MTSHKRVFWRATLVVIGLCVLVGVCFLLWRYLPVQENSKSEPPRLDAATNKFVKFLIKPPEDSGPEWSNRQLDGGLRQLRTPQGHDPHLAQRLAEDAARRRWLFPKPKGGGIAIIRATFALTPERQP